jgi:transcriptional regulator with XRE-family HTH domain
VEIAGNAVGSWYVLAIWARRPPPRAALERGNVSYRDDNAIGSAIATLLAEQGRSQVELAGAIGMDSTALNKLISGRRSLTGTELVLIATELSVTPQSLIRMDEEPVFALRADIRDEDAIREFMRDSEELIDGYLRLEALVPHA